MGIKVKIKKQTKPKPTLVNFKVTKAELKALTARAKKFAGGNVSLWLRHAAINYTPKRKDVSR